MKSSPDTDTHFKSDYFDDSEQVLSGYNEAYSNSKDRREKLLIVRKFTNMLPTLTEEEKREMGRTEITNHGLSYRNMAQIEGQLTSMVTVTNSLVEVVVDTDNPEQDIITSQRVSEAINKGAIHHKGKGANFWRKVAGEIAIAGGGPVTFPPKYGWLPKIAPDMLFPPETDLDSENIPYAFDPVELSVCDLRKLKKSVKEESSNYIHVANIDKLIKKIEDAVKGETTSSFSYQQEISKSVRNPKVDNTKVRAFWFYEPKWVDSESKVSATLVVQDTTVDLEAKSSSNAVVIAYIDKAYEDAAQWCHLVCVDSEIGGVKNLDTLRGVAEMQYSSALDSEELVNLIMEGAKILARPKVRLVDGANKDDVLKWDIMRDTFAPAGVEELSFKNNTNALQVPLQILSQNAAGLSATTSGGGSEDLRVEALDKQRGNAMLTTNRISEAYNHLESILETMVWRLLAGETKPGAEGFLETMWVRDYLKKYDIDGAKLAERKYGRFVHIRVRAHRSVGNGDRVQQIETAKWLMDNITQFSPQVRPLALRMAVILQTQDPDLADVMVAVPKAIINAQKITAETESNVIEDIASLGQTLPVGADDIHQDHIPVHLRTMQGWVATDTIRPWDKLDVVIFAGMTEHVMEHIKILLSNKATNEEAKSYMQAAQQIIASAQGIVQAVEEREGSEQSQMTHKEQADLQLKWADKEFQARKLGLDIEKNKRLFEASEARQANIRRAQYTKEIDSSRRFGLDEKKLEIAKTAKKTTTSKKK